MVEPLDFEEIFVNLFAGSREIFLFVAIAFFAFLAAKMKMVGTVFMILMALFIIFLAGGGYVTFLYSLIILLGGLFIYYAFSKITNG